MDPREALDALDDAVALVGSGGVITFANASLQRLVGSARLASRTVLEATRSAELSEFVYASDQEGRARQLTLPGNDRTVLVQRTLLSTGERLVLLRDVTESKRVDATRRDFVANASHELRTPVAAIVAAAETLLGEGLALGAEARPFVEMIARQAHRLAQLTQHLLDLTRLESGEWKLDLRPLDLAGVAERARELLGPAAAEKGLRIELSVPNDRRALGDDSALEQVLVNLLDNAVKYSPAGGLVSLTALSEGSFWTVSVKDSGPGIEAHHLARIFERFYRADPGRARQMGGTGLGLAIVKRLVQAQGGEVGVESGAGGSRFWFRLRRA